VTIPGKENQCDPIAFTRQSPINLDTSTTFPPITDLIPEKKDAKLLFHPGSGCKYVINDGDAAAADDDDDHDYDDLVLGGATSSKIDCMQP